MGRVSERSRLVLVTMAVAATWALHPAAVRAQPAGPSDTSPSAAQPQGPPAGPLERPVEAMEPATEVPPERLEPSASSPEEKPSQEEPSREGTSPGEPPQERPKEANWLDVGHAFIERGLFAPVLRFDRFFSDERELEAERSRSFLRWRSEIRFDETIDVPAFTTGLRANLRFPGLNKRLEQLRIVIAGQTRNAVEALFPSEPGTSTTPPTEEVEEPAIGTANAELRFRFWETLVSHADLGAGLIFRVPPGAFGRLRLRFVLPVRRLFLTRYVAIGFWRTDTHFGTSAAIEAERPFGRMLVARLGGNATLHERSRGVEWLSEFVWLASFSERSAAQAGATLSGATGADPPQTFERLRVYTRLRRDFYRRWLFFELEPDVYWQLAPGTDHQAIFGVSLRLEVQFQGTERPVPPPSPAPSEPKDPR